MVESVLHDCRVEADVNSELIAQHGRTSVLVHGSPAVEVDDNDRQIAMDGLLNLPPHELLQIPSAFTDKKNEHLGIPHPLRELRLDGRFLARITRGVQLMSVVEIEREAVVLLPRLHQPVVVDVRVSVEGDERLVPIRHSQSSLVTLTLRITGKIKLHSEAAQINFVRVYAIVGRSRYAEKRLGI